jgi:protein-S-isoprenylcysteine O-methyltransferase Ste14
MPRLVISMLFLAALLFLPAGRLDWGMGWAFIGLHLAVFIITISALLARNPDLIAERTKVVTKDTKGWDPIVTGILSLALLGMWVAAGLDERLGWSPDMELGVQIGALVLVALGYAAFQWAMLSNPHFTRDVRIQEDRGHAVTSGGPYRIVRHPGYAGFIVAMLATSPALGSTWAIILGGLASAMLVVRTALEDKMLREELPGYAKYAQRTRYRLLPGIW